MASNFAAVALVFIVCRHGLKTRRGARKKSVRAPRVSASLRDVFTMRTDAEKDVTTIEIGAMSWAN